MKINILVLGITLLAIALSCKDNGIKKLETTEGSKTYKDIDVDELNEMLATGEYRLLDVRTPEETAQGMIDRPLQIDYRGDRFEAGLSRLVKDQKFIVYCRSGVRSANTCEKMKEMGFKEVYNLKGGYQAYQQM